MTRYRLAQLCGEDRPALFGLWRQVFGDDDAFIAGCLDVFAGQGHVYVAEEDGVVLAMLLAVPCRINNGCAGVYFYALATAPAARGVGVMSGLMGYAEQAAVRARACFAALIPAAPGLYAYYGARGYTVPVRLAVLEPALIPCKARDLLSGRVTSKRLEQARAEWLGVRRVVFGGARAALAAKDLNGMGARMTSLDGAYAVWFLGQNRLLVAELGARDGAAAQRLLNALCAHTGVINAKLTLPEDSPLFCTANKTLEPAGLIKSLTPGENCPRVYLRFALDNPG